MIKDINRTQELRTKIRLLTVKPQWLLVQPQLQVPHQPDVTVVNGTIGTGTIDAVRISA